MESVRAAYGLTFAGFLLLGGRAADLLGRRRLLMAGVAVFTAASLAGGLATSDAFLIVMRGLQGLGAALVLPAALSIVMNMFPEGAERNKALGIWGGVGALGGTVGLLAGGILTTYAGWQYIFFFNVPIGAAALALAPTMVPESRARGGQRRYDPFGAVSITAALLVFVYAISQAPQVGWAAPRPSPCSPSARPCSWRSSSSRPGPRRPCCRGLALPRAAPPRRRHRGRAHRRVPVGPVGVRTDRSGRHPRRLRAHPPQPGPGGYGILIRCTCCGRPVTDLALVNANVLTMDPNRPRATAVAMAQGRITALDEVPPGAARVVDLRGATVLPGFHDAHNHMIGFGMSLGEVDIGSPPVGSLDELYAAIARRAETTAPGEWVIGSGYDQNKLGGHHPDRDALDRAAPGRRVWLRHTSGHMCVVNSAVLADLGIDAAATELPGGRVATDAGGRPTGLLEERAQLLVGSLVYPYPLAELTDAIARAGRQYLKEGVTSCTEAGIGGGWVAHSPAELAAYAAARDQGKLGVRVELMTAGEVLHPLGAHADDNLVAGLDLGISTGFGDDWLRLGAVKIFADGSLVGRTAALHDPYYHSDTAGYLQADAADLRTAIIAAHRSGWQVATHAIGDRAIDLVLDAYADALAQYPRPDPRHRIEHFAVVQPRQVARAAELGVIAVPQGRFATELGDGMLAAVGPDRHAWLYRQRSLLEAGMVLPGSSDRPVVAGAPLLGIDGMVNRRTSSGAPFNPDEAVSAEQALRAWTRGSAYASRQEHVKGSIAPGMLADLVVLSEDPTAVSPDRIAGLEVLATIAGGVPRYDAGVLG